MEWVLPAIGLFLLIAMAAAAIAAYAMHIAFKSIIAVKALQNSTHSVQYVPLETADAKTERDLQHAYAKGEFEDVSQAQDLEDDYSHPLM